MAGEQNFIPTLRASEIWFDIQQQTQQALQAVPKETATLCPFSLLKKVFFPNLGSLSIESDIDRDNVYFENYVNSILFHVSCKYDKVFIIQRDIDRLLGWRGNSQKRRINLSVEPQGVPERLCNTELLYYYQAGVASEVVPYKYLSFYRIIEFFFQDTFYQQIFAQVQQVTDRNFGGLPEEQRVREIEQLNGALRDYLGNNLKEDHALKAVLRQHVNLSDLIRDIRRYEDTLIAYFRDEEVRFSDDGRERILRRFDLDTVDLNDNGACNRVLDSIAERIYTTRNAIVHSKAWEKNRSIPFRHDTILLKEIPIVRFIANYLILLTP